MDIYVAHPTNYDFKKELYEPIRQSSLNKEHTFVLPHEKTDKQFNSKDYLKRGCNLFIAEVSIPSIGLGIELGWANIYNVPIIFIYKSGAKLSGALKVVSDKFIEYSNSEELIQGIKEIINDMKE